MARLSREIRNYTVEDLEQIHGVGMKTSRFFVVHSRPDQRYTILDTHILKWLGKQGYNVPKSTPPRKRYLELEKTFLDECDKRNRNPAELDLEIWNEYSKI